MIQIKQIIEKQCSQECIKQIHTVYLLYSCSQNTKYKIYTYKYAYMIKRKHISCMQCTFWVVGIFFCKIIKKLITLKKFSLLLHPSMCVCLNGVLPLFPQRNEVLLGCSTLDTVGYSTFWIIKL